MPAVVTELNIGRRSSFKDGQRTYHIDNATDEADARTSLLAATPLVVNGLLRVDADCEVEETTNYNGKITYTGVAKYASSDNRQTQTAGNFSIGFEVGTTTITQTHAIQTVHTYKAAGAPDRDFKDAINVDSDGKIQGVDIISPVFSWHVNFTITPESVTDAYVVNLSNFVGKVNLDVFKGFPAGELLLTRVSGQRRDGQAWDIDYSFSVSKNVTNRAIGGITGISKKGWEYLSIFSQDKEDTANHVTTQVPVYARVLKVYDDVAYVGLGISGLATT